MGNKSTIAINYVEGLQSKKETTFFGLKDSKNRSIIFINIL